MSVIAKVQSARNTLLDKLEGLIDSSPHSVDANTQFFYVYKAFPKGLSAAELKQWCALQEDLLSPFAVKHLYKYRSHLGIHLWYAKHEIHGIPETALQAPPKDGIATVSGEHFDYQQTWTQGILVANLAIKPTEQNRVNYPTLQIQNISKAWGIERKIDRLIAKPASWLTFSFAIFGLCLLWLIIAYSTISIQKDWITKQNQELTEAIGPQLTDRQLLDDAQNAVKGLDAWRSEYANFPNTISASLAELSALAEVRINQWQWQNNTLVLEFVSTQINITELVENTQQLERVKSANIRPHNDSNTWVLELEWN